MVVRGIKVWLRGRRSVPLGTHLARVALLTAMAVYALAIMPGRDVFARSGLASSNTIRPAEPDSTVARRLFSNALGELAITREDENPPVWRISGPAGLIGFIASTWEITGSVGYSGQPIDILVGISSHARITSAELVRHNEPVLTLGISSDDIAKYIQGFAGFDLTAPKVDAFKDSSDVPPIIAGATVSTGVIRDAILRTARAVALGRGLIRTKAAVVDRVSFERKDWTALAGEDALAMAKLTFAEAKTQFGPIANPLPDTENTFFEVWTTILDPPTIGRNLLGQQAYTRAVASLGPGDSLLLIASNGVHSHRGTRYRQTGIFERLEIIQGDSTIKLKKEEYLRVDRLAAEGAPTFKETSIFRIPAKTGFNPASPFRVEITAERERSDGSKAVLRVPVTYELPAAYVVALPAEADASEQPLWVSAWERKPLTIAFTAVMIACVAASFFIQEVFVRNPKLWFYARLGFLSVTLVVLGWIAKGQLSVVQVVAFLHSLLNGFRWETFLIEPVIFLLWSFVALGLLFWGRGVYCGWLCPFGALQELLNECAKKFGVKQVEVPFAVQERLWAIKYTLFVAILGVSFYSMDQALILAEAEPFKTAISMRFMREWPFIAFVVALLIAGLFIERFYCRYLCPLGAALAIPAKLKLFDWLHRRPQCGRECRFCETQCTVGAIDSLGRINPNECILCLRCQVIMLDEAQCIALKRRAQRTARQQARAPAAPDVASAPTNL